MINIFSHGYNALCYLCDLVPTSSMCQQEGSSLHLVSLMHTPKTQALTNQFFVRTMRNNTETIDFRCPFAFPRKCLSRLLMKVFSLRHTMSKNVLYMIFREIFVVFVNNFTSTEKESFDEYTV
jgi:hypothetical protein